MTIQADFDGEESVHVSHALWSGDGDDGVDGGDDDSGGDDDGDGDDGGDDGVAQCQKTT